MNIKYEIFKCKNCEIEFSNPMKSAPPSHYQKVEYYSYRWEFIEFLKFFKIFKNKKLKILDIGCGEGHFLYLAQKNGFEVVGIDINEKAIKVAKEKFGIKRVYPFDLSEFIKNFPEEKFDIICAFHLIEHLEDPISFLFKVREILKEKGFFVFSLPNDRRLTVRIKEREDWDYPPHHLTRWNERSINFLIKKANFKIIKIKDEEPFVLLLDTLMKRIHFDLTKKILEKKKIKENTGVFGFNTVKLNKLAKIKKILFFPFAFLLYLPLKFLKIKGVAKFLIVKKVDGS
ncbi:MAG: class I SAM-dependent methyltransferase [candidate division WOR-3 bacterium]